MPWWSEPGRIERVLEVTRRLATPVALGEMLASVVDAGREVLDADRGTVLLYEPATDELISTVATGATEIRIPAGHGLAGECARTRSVVNVPDAYADPRFRPETDRATGYRTRHVLTVPLLDDEDALVGVLQLLNKRGGPFDADDESLATVLAAQCAVAIRRVRMVEGLVEKRKLDREMEVARRIQAALLPRDPVLPAGFDVAGVSRPATHAGGDAFDLVPTGDGGMLVLLGDASGHGVGPAISVTQVRSMLRLAARVGLDLEAAFRHVNDQVTADLDAARFVTAFVGRLQADSGSVRYHAAGQGPLLRLPARGGPAEWLAPTTVPMGVMAHDPSQAASRLDLEPGDLLALVTDGVYEAEDGAGVPFGRDGVLRVLSAGAERPMADLAEALLREVDRHRGGAEQDDDMTAVLIRRLPV